MSGREQTMDWKRVTEPIARHLRLGVPADDLPEPCAELPDTIRVLEEFVAREEREVAAAHHAWAMTLPRFVCDGWGHIFSEARGDTETRWVFDRHLWCLATLHVWEYFRADWERALPDEVMDVEDSLIHANEAQWDCAGRDLLETNDVPGWAAAPLPRRSCCLLEDVPRR